MKARIELRRFLNHTLAPAAVTLVITALMSCFVLVQLGGEALSFARLGTRFSSGNAAGTSGYDGQFVYYITRDLNPITVSPHLDTPAYRYQRILMPFLARGLSLNYLPAMPWLLVFLGIVSQTVGTWSVGELVHAWGMSRWYALVYGLWVGFLLAILVDLPEPLAYGLIALGWYIRQKKRHGISWILFGLALFAKEVTILFVAALWIADLLQRRWRNVLGIALVSILPYALFQVWLWSIFGQLGIASGGEMATPFEWFPFMGLWRIGSASWLYLIAMLVVFGPAVLLPVVWGAWSSIRHLIADGCDETDLALLFNCLAIVFLPYSTFRETGGLLRFTCGLVLATLLFASRNQLKRVLNYSRLWLVLNVFLFKSPGI